MPAPRILANLILGKSEALPAQIVPSRLCVTEAPLEGCGSVRADGPVRGVAPPCIACDIHRPPVITDALRMH